MPPRRAPQINPAGLVDAELKVLDVIKSKKELGITAKSIIYESKLDSHAVKQALNSLLGKGKIKEVVNAQNKRTKLFMAAEFEPSDQVTGGDWYENGSLNHDVINVLKRLCIKCINVQKVATLEGVHSYVKKSGVLNYQISSQKVGEIVNSMVLDNDIIEVKSTGYGDYHSIRIGEICYRSGAAAEAGRGPKVGVFASIPCGACPSISLCRPGGVVSPSTCVYYNKWLNIDF